MNKQSRTRKNSEWEGRKVLFGTSEEEKSSMSSRNKQTESVPELRFKDVHARAHHEFIFITVCPLNNQSESQYSELIQQ